MAAPQIFRVLTEFRFEIGAAAINSKKLKGSVDQISDAADNALLSFQRLSLGIVSSFVSGPGGGVLGVLGTALRVSDSFTQSQIALANVMGRSSGTFQQRMAFAEKSMERIGRLATATGISGQGLVDFTKTLTPALAPKLGGQEAVTQSAELGRVFLKSAPSLGVDQFTGLRQTRRLVLGLDAAGNQLFDVLTADTEAMKEFAGQGKKFQALPIGKKVKILTAAFGQFANDSQVVAARFNTMSGQFQILKENLIGVNSVVRRLGRTFTTVVVQALKAMNNLISGPVKFIADNLAFGLEPFVDDLEKLFTTLAQAKGLKKDVSGAGNFLTNTALILGFKEILQFLGIRIPFVTGALRKFSQAILFLDKPLGKQGSLLSRFLAGPSKGFIGWLNKVFTFTTRILGAAALLTLVSSILTRTAAFVKINSAKRLIDVAEAFSKVVAKFLRLMGIMNDGMNNLSKTLAASPFIDFMFFLADVGIKTLDLFTNILTLAMAGIQGLTNAISQLFLLANLNKDAVRQATLSKEQGGSGGIFNSIKDAFNFGTDQIFERVFGKLENGEAVSNKVTNVNVKMNNNFKEVLQPDRIAFTISDQLSKLAQNPRGASGASFKPFGKVTQ